MVKNMLRRMLSFILVFALLAPTIFGLPVFSITASAATELALSVDGLSASYETSGGANSVWSADGNQLSYAGNSYPSGGCGGYNSASCQLTLKNTSGRPGLLEFSYSCSSTGIGASTKFNVNGNNTNLDSYDTLSGSFKGDTAISLAPEESITVSTYLDQGSSLSATLSGITLTLTGYTITSSLNNLSSSNTASYVDENTEYTTTLKPANGYMLPETIKVTMGGTELSSGYIYNSATGSLTISDVTGDVVITAAGIAKTWSLAVTEDHTFAEVHVGYTQAPAAETFTIENTGNQDAANLTVTLLGDNADSFTLNTGSMATALSIGDTTSFTVQPVIGLDAGTYSANAVITADNISESISLSFTVSAHVFNEEDYTVTKEASCTEAGEKIAVCAHSGCTATDTKAIEALEHDYHAVVTDPTCEEKGYTTYTCIRCSESYVGDYTDATGHTWGEWETVTELSCETGGYRTRSCSVCGKREEEQVSETGHTWDTAYTVDKEATCTTDGSKSIHCTECGAVKPGSSEVIPATGHSFTKYVSNNNATCTGDGTKTAACDHGCGATDTETDAGTALGHDFTASETVAATCTSEGYTLYTCTRCSEKEKRDLTDALGHTPGAAATCTTDQVCTVCKTILAGKFGHTGGQQRTAQPTRHVQPAVLFLQLHLGIQLGRR